MTRRTIAPLGATVLIASLALAGCGSRDSGTSSGGASGDANKTATIGIIAPLSGKLSALGLGIQHSVELAVKEANESNAIPGWTIKVSAQDDEANPDIGKNAATKLAADDTVVGVVGTLNSSVAQPVQPILAAAKIAQVSPANTNPTLTKGADPLNNPKRTYPTYFRTCVTDDVQGRFAAEYLFSTAGIKEVAVIHDNKTYGKGLSDAFAKSFAALGGKVVARATINPDDSNYNTAINAVKGAAPKAVYYGGEYPEAGPLSRQMKAAGLNVPLMGGDGIYDPTFIQLGSATSAGDLATSVGKPTEQLEKGKTFLENYQKAGYKDASGAYGAYSYDAAQAIIEALKVSLKDASDPKAARQATVDALGKVSFDGVTGKVGFDEYGDALTRIVSAYKVEGGKWVPEATKEYTD